MASGTPILRPKGQTAGNEQPNFGPTQRLDLELELGLLIGAGNALGEPIPIAQAEEHLFGVTLFNDWSARDIQAWEYQPLGPFLAKNFASSISAWVVTPEALAPFRAPFTRAASDPQPLPYLDDAGNRAQGALDIQLGVRLQSAAMREAGVAPMVLSQSPVAQAAYWTPAQLIAHHTVNGCNLQPAAGRPSRFRHLERPGAAAGGVAAGTDSRWQGTHHPADWREANLTARRRRAGTGGLV